MQPTDPGGPGQHHQQQQQHQSQKQQPQLTDTSPPKQQTTSTWTAAKTWIDSWRGSRRLVLVIVAIALLLDNMLLTTVGKFNYLKFLTF